MRELYEQILTYVRGSWRYRWYMMLVAWVGCIVGWGFIQQLPDEYEASARIHVDTQTILQPLLRGLAVSTNTEQRVRLVTRTLLSRPNLEKLARMTDLDLLATTPMEKEKLLDDLGKDITIGTDAREQDIYRVSYSDSDPDLAKRVVQSLLTTFVESALGGSRQDSNNAQEFLDQQIKEYEGKLVAAEQRLADFKRTHVGMMPGSQDEYYNQLRSAQTALQEAQLALHEAQNQREQIAQQREDDEDSYLMYTELVPQSGSALDMRIQNLNEQLDNLLIRYTERHPDVIEIKNMIATLEEKRKEELALMDDLDMGPAGDPVYQQMKLQLAQADANVASLKTRVGEYQDRVNQLQKMVDTIPTIEAEYQQLNRDYGVHQANYQQLLASREQASMSEQMEMSGDQIQFRVVDPPRVPLTPSAPNRPLLMSGVLVLSLAAGIALAFLLYLLRPTFDNPQAVINYLGRPVLGAVSMIYDEAWGRKRRHALIAFSLAGTGLLVMYVVMMTLAGMDIKVAAITSLLGGRG
jgi:polysaccharide chain length determinant protein (PEP-CTERM system associated)